MLPQAVDVEPSSMTVTAAGSRLESRIELRQRANTAGSSFMHVTTAATLYRRSLSSVTPLTVMGPASSDNSSFALMTDRTAVPYQPRWMTALPFGASAM